jgi:hypothetical protein
VALGIVAKPHKLRSGRSIHAKVIGNGREMRRPGQTSGIFRKSDHTFTAHIGFKNSFPFSANPKTKTRVGLSARYPMADELSELVRKGVAGFNTVSVAGASVTSWRLASGCPEVLARQFLPISRSIGG